MTNRLQLFTESVSHLGIAKPELEALTELVKACLESAVSDMDDGFDPDNPEYDSELNIIDNSTATDEEEEQLPDADSDFDTLSKKENRDMNELLRYRQEEVNTPEVHVHESTVGTKLAETYIKVAPKLLDIGKCTPDEIENLSAFITWLCNKFNSFNQSEYMANLATKLNKGEQDYNEEQMDKVVGLLNIGPAVVQLLNEINNTENAFHDNLVSASLTNSKDVFAVAPQINTFVADMFQGFEEGNAVDTREDPDILYDDTGFIDIPEEEDEPTDEEATEETSTGETSTGETSTEGETATLDDNATNPEEESDTGFPADTSVETVEKAVNDFIELIPTIDLNDEEAEAFAHAGGKNKAKEVADRRAELKKQNSGNVIESGRRRSNPWANRR